MDILKKFINNPGLEHLAENIIGFMDIDKAMEIMTESDELSEDERKFFKKAFQKSILKEFQEICQNQDCVEVFPAWKLKKFFNHPEFGHLAEKIIGFLDIDQAMEIMIESDQLSEDERKFFKKTLKESMFKETKELCEKLKFFEVFPGWKKDLDDLNNHGTLKSFNELYDILVLLQEVPEWCLKWKTPFLLYNVTDVPDDMMGFLKIVVEIEDIDKFLMDLLNENMKDMSTESLGNLLSLMKELIRIFTPKKVFQ